MTRIAFDVTGTPVPQGSTRAFVVNGRAVTTSASGQNLKHWRQSIAQAAQDARNGEFADKGVPVAIRLTFELQRPKSTPKRITRPTTKPDLDKLIRASLDALTGVVFADDSQVVQIETVKVYAEGAPGVSVLIRWGENQ